MKKLFFFGIDSAEWDLIMPWVKEGKLPGFKKLLGNGLKYDMISSIPPFTPVAWTTMYTGTQSGKHDIYDFYRLNKNLEISVNTFAESKQPTFFEYLSKAGIRTAILNFPLTFPLKPINGILLTDFLTPGLEADFIYPESLRDEFIKKFPKYTFSEQANFGHGDESREKFLKELKNGVATKIKVFDWIEEKDDWGFFGINFMEVDHVQHWYWHYHDKTHPKYEEHKKFKNAMLEVYQMIDGYLLKKLKEKKYDHYMIFSDHGAGPYVQNLNFNAFLQRNKLLTFKKDFNTILKTIAFKLGLTPTNVLNVALKLNWFIPLMPNINGGGKNKMFLGIDDIDWKKTDAYSFGCYGQIYLKKKDKQTREKIVKLLKELEYDNKKVVKDIWLKEEVFHGPYAKNAPDIVFNPADFAIGVPSVFALFNDTTDFSAPSSLKSGEHRMEGIFSIYPKDPMFKKQESLKLYDITATIMNYFGLPIPSQMDGTSLIGKKAPAKGSEVDDIEI